MADLPEVDVGSLWEALEQAADLAGLAVYVARVDVTPPRVVHASLRAAELIGRGAPATLIGMDPSDILRLEDRPKIAAMVARPRDAPPSSIEVTIERPDGVRVPILLSATRMVTPTATFTFGYFRDLTAERANVTALQKAETRFRVLVERAPDGVVILKRGTITFANPKAAQLLAELPVQDILGRTIREFLPPEDARLAFERIQKILATGREMPPNEYRVLVDPARTVEIKSVPVEWEGEPAIMAFARDVTERKAIQRRLVDADRLAALGTLAAAVAHEINNPLTYAQLSSQRIERALAVALPAEQAAEVTDQLRDIEHAISRIASITAGLRSFARPDEAPPGAVDLVQVVERALKMVDNDLRHRALLVKQLAAVPPVTGTPARLEQVVVNVLLNAIKAVTGESGLATIEVSLAQRDDTFVVVTIRDSGPGIPAHARPRIFDPFFTTRAFGEGMGLGLAVSKTIVESVGGEIAVASEDGAGTTVTIALRIHAKAAVEPAAPGAVTPGPRRRVLVIDDEPLVRNVLAKLIASDHAVVTAAGGAEALALLATMQVDVILCDVMMPGMNGREVHRRVAELYPGLERKIVFISGGSFAPDLEAFLEKLPNPRLSKPFRVEAVLAVVEQIAKDN